MSSLAGRRFAIRARNVVVAKRGTARSRANPAAALSTREIPGAAMTAFTKRGAFDAILAHHGMSPIA